ncbi:MAG: tRNA (adenosine(37)-N6)-threonylcarbamoyltransferase complex ATPase subunit type 1 TsaE [Oscillospiraceae bacterium]|nr:tRNA (adenosine(37)-N6)-threonylcarbamoyltransferase complex ATPase subunit type 1 TsaE [Oscillospiraceae bacterium]
MSHTVLSPSPAATQAVGRALAGRLRPGDVVALFGPLGMGKTCFVRGLAEGLGCAGTVSSPTYALVHEHPGPTPLAHFDMYRITSWEDLESTGFFDYLDQAFVLAVEWSEHIASALPPNCVRVAFAPGQGENERMITIEHGGSA